MGNNSERVIRVFDTPEEATRIWSLLRSSGFPSQSITLLSSEPIHAAAEESGRVQPSRIGFYSVLGAIVGGVCGLLLTVLPSKEVDLVTGGMPIITPWAFGIIIFELTALGAIFATLGRMVLEAGLMWRDKATECDSAVADGKVVLLVNCLDADQRAIAERLIIQQRSAT